MFCCYSHLVWSTLMEILISSSLLYVVLGRAAFGGLVVLIVSLCVGLAVSKLYVLLKMCVHFILDA
jgi:hypothetical protein